MSAPIRFHDVDQDGTIRVTVGKSDLIRNIPLTRRQKIRIIKDMAESLGDEDPR